MARGLLLEVGRYDMWAHVEVSVIVSMARGLLLDPTYLTAPLLDVLAEAVHLNGGSDRQDTCRPLLQIMILVTPSNGHAGKLNQGIDSESGCCHSPGQAWCHCRGTDSTRIARRPATPPTAARGLEAMALHIALGKGSQSRQKWSKVTWMMPSYGSHVPIRLLAGK